MTYDLADYVGIHRSEVSPLAVRVADLVLAIAIPALGLAPSTKVCWFRPTSVAEVARLRTRKDTLGFVERDDRYLDTVWVKVGRPDAELVKTVAHELRHCYQHRRGRWPQSENDRVILENDANEWANLVAERIVFSTSGTPIYYP